jgi:amino acid adenylation domain-containing protein
VISANKTLTYEELYKRSVQIGRQLRDLGASPNKLVAVVMEKGWEQVVAVLGILESGAAYLPIDPDLPKERLWYLLKHGGVEFVLTQPLIDEQTIWPEGIQRLYVDNEFPINADEYSSTPVQKPQDLAYVIYTSGSTGFPKGVMIDHRGAVNTIIDINNRFGIGPKDRVMALSSLSFDLSVYDIFGTLAAGGTIVIPNPSLTRDPSHWAKLIVQEQVTVWNSVPALMEMLVEYTEGRSEHLPGSLRLVMLSGDWIPIDLPDRIRSLSENVHINSLGGATEASIWSITYPINAVDSTWKSIPYGKPMMNQKFHVLNDRLDPCPVWARGQLFIGGDGLARGYWRDEEKTNASFIKHYETGERLYRTGDLGRYLPDGNIEFLGREDFQVKVQGNRIELGEIEAALMQFPKVQAAVVTVIGEQHGSKSLVAYVVTDEKQLPKIEERERIISTREVILDPIERLKFKLKHLGLRKDNNKPHIQLNKPTFTENEIKDYIARRSYRNFEQKSISLEQFSKFLSCLLQLRHQNLPLPKYQYGSAGALYPVQTYLYVKSNRVESLSEGTYYYNPSKHHLVLLSDAARIERDIYDAPNQPIFDESAFAIFLIGQLDAITPMYGDLAEKFCLIETGLITQLLEMSAPNCNIGLCQIGRLDFQKIQHYLRLDRGHMYMHCLLGGKIGDNQLKLQSAIEDYAEISNLLESLEEESTSEDKIHSEHEKTSLTSSADHECDSGIGDIGNDIESELRTFLAEKLPNYMVPSTFIFLDQLPLTPNGKVDRNALPNIPGRSLGTICTTESPRQDMAGEILQIVSSVLKVDNLDCNIDLRQLGVNSLDILRIVNQIETRFGFRPKLVEIFNLHSVDEIANHVTYMQRNTE